MKVWVHKVPIYAMATDRSSAIRKLDQLSDVLWTHVLRLGIYDDILDCKSHWINEIATHISAANDIRIKSGDGKLDAATYQHHLIGGLGDERNDAHVDIRIFQAQNSKTNLYPDFDTENDTIIDRVFHLYQIITELVVGTLPYKNTFKKSDFYYYLKERV